MICSYQFRPGQGNFADFSLGPKWSGDLNKFAERRWLSICLRGQRWEEELSNQDCPSYSSQYLWHNRKHIELEMRTCRQDLAVPLVHSSWTPWNNSHIFWRSISSLTYTLGIITDLVGFKVCYGNHAYDYQMEKCIKNIMRTVKWNTNKKVVYTLTLFIRGLCNPGINKARISSLLKNEFWIRLLLSLG